MVAVRKIEEFGPAEQNIERDTGRLRALYDAQKKIGSAPDLAEVRGQYGAKRAVPLLRARSKPGYRLKF